MTKPHRDNAELDLIRSAAIPLEHDHDDAAVLQAIGDASLVLLGEASHGTHEFYAFRTHLTRRLIEERGFAAVAIEGDWPDAYRVNRYVAGDRESVDAVDALAGFRRFPTWMWRNTAVAEFIMWLRTHNTGSADPARRTGFYGMDLYSLHASMRAVVEYLEERDPAAAKAARASYSCFEDFGPEPDEYAWATSRLGEETCEEAVARELSRLRSRAEELLHTDAPAESDEYFFAVQNARLATNAERYYRTMARGRHVSWNLRDQHMAETLDELLAHLRRRGQPSKLVVWAHNSHLGDARATEFGDAGEINVGQLVREKYGNAARLVGFTTHAGSVMAAPDWGEPGRLRRVRPALEGSFEELFHRAGLPRFLLRTHATPDLSRALNDPRLERAIGVIYRPETERMSHYFHARLADQFDAVIHFDETHAVDPLEHDAVWEPSEAPETYPSGV